MLGLLGVLALLPASTSADLFVNGASQRALLIGCNSYADEGIADLQSAEADARRLFETLGCARPWGETSDPPTAISDLRLLTDEGLVSSTGRDERTARPTLAKIRQELRTVLSHPKGAETVLVYFSGQLHHSKRTGKDYLAPADACLDHPEETCLAVDGLLRQMQQARAAHAVLILDAGCDPLAASALEYTSIAIDGVLDILRRSGAAQAALIVDASRNTVGRDIESDFGAASTPAAEAKGIWFLASCAPGQVSRSTPSTAGALYARSLTEALRGAADGAGGGRRDNLVTVREAQAFVQDSVAAYTRQDPPVQMPTCSAMEVEDGEMVLAQCQDR